MSRPVSSLILALMLLLLTTPCPPAVAGMIDAVAADFQPLSGCVIMPAEGEFLLDLGLAKGVREGELFSVMIPGAKIVHPLTQEVLGALDKVKATLQVSRVQADYSFSRSLGGAAPIESGDPVRRYLDVPATFWDYAGAGEPFFAELKAALLHLKWQSYDAAQAARPQVPAAPRADGPLLLFILHDDRLEVRDSRFGLLRTYPRAEHGRPDRPPPRRTAVACRGERRSTGWAPRWKGVRWGSRSATWTGTEISRSPRALPIGWNLGG